MNACIVYDCPYTIQGHLLISRKALYTPSLEHNLLPPFILCKAGLNVNDTPKIHSVSPQVSDHAISFEDEDLLIPSLYNELFHTLIQDGQHWRR